MYYYGKYVKINTSMSFFAILYKEVLDVSPRIWCQSSHGLHHNRPGSVLFQAMKFYPPEKMVYLGIIFRFATQKHRPVLVAGEDESVHKAPCHEQRSFRPGFRPSCSTATPLVVLRLVPRCRNWGDHYNHALGEGHCSFATGQESRANRWPVGTNQ